MSRETRATTVVSQPARFSTASVSERERRSHASCTASSASLAEPSIRYATDCRCCRLRSNSSVCRSLRVTSHLRVRIRHLPDERNAAVVTARRERHERNRSDQAQQDLPRRRRSRERDRLRGHRRRLEIARALVSHPLVLFLDEPTVGLDPRIRAELLEVIAGLRSRSELTVLPTTHYLEEAERLCDRVAIIHAGRIVALDTPAALLAGLGRQLVELRVDGSVSSALAALRDRGVAGEDAFAVGSRVTVPLHGHSSSEAIAAIHDLGLAGAISAREPTLDDVYLRLTGDSLAAAA